MLYVTPLCLVISGVNIVESNITLRSYLVRRVKLLRFSLQIEFGNNGKTIKKVIIFGTIKMVYQMLKVCDKRIPKKDGGIKFFPIFL